jgi:hypothetical protein
MQATMLAVHDASSMQSNSAPSLAGTKEDARGRTEHTLSSGNSSNCITTTAETSHKAFNHAACIKAWMPALPPETYCDELLR